MSSAATGDGAAARYRRDERVLWRSAPDEVVVVLAPSDDVPRSLAGTGAALWRALERPRTLDELVSGLAAQYGADPDVVRRDVAPLLDELVELGALRAAP